MEQKRKGMEGQQHLEKCGHCLCETRTDKMLKILEYKDIGIILSHFFIHLIFFLKKMHFSYIEHNWTGQHVVRRIPT
jgi:hypothetical protein